MLIQTGILHEHQQETIAEDRRIMKCINNKLSNKSADKNNLLFQGGPFRKE